jgi:hypothetical protein
MEIVIALLSILTVGLMGKNWFLGWKMRKMREEADSDAIKNKLLEMSARQLKIKNDVERMSLDDLVNRKRDGDGDNS